MPFVHLHTHSHYSLLDGLAKIDELVARAKELGMTALALTDHGVLYGAIEFYQKARAAGIKPIIGIEAYVARAGRGEKRGADDRPYHLILLARNATGYRNLIQLSTKAHLEGFYYKPRIDWELLEEYGQGLIALSGCLNGELAHAIRAGKHSHAEELVRRFQKVFGMEHFYLEVQYRPTLAEQATHNAALVELSRKTGAPVVATNDIHYALPGDVEAQDILLCIQTKKLLTDANRMSFAGEDYSMVSAETMAERFADLPEAIANTVRIAEACMVELELGKIILPHFPVPEQKTADGYLRDLCERALENRFGTNPAPQVKERLNYELEVIEKTGFAPFFLIVQDFVRWAKENGIVVGPGRGSAASSIVAYLTRITNIDPLRYELLFERFLNPERISMPDFDIDFADTRRDEVIRYVEGKYGKDHVAQIITFGTMAARAAVRDVGRVMGLPYAYCDRVAKLIPFFAKLDEAISAIPELRDIHDNDPQGRKLLENAKRLEGVARHASTHACGVVITREPVSHYVPLQYASQDDTTVITQYSLHPIEDLGLLKLDFLGLRNLTVLEQAMKIVAKTRGVTVDIDHLPLDDPKTFRLLQVGNTTGVFQLESSGMRRYLIELKPTALEDIIAMVSLYRPGPMEFIPHFIAGKHGRAKTTYLHPKLQPILEKTYGVAVYQEQIMQIARDLAGFTLGEADVLRKAVGKKIAKLLKEQREKFIAGCVQNGIEHKTAEKIFDFIEPFARYGFNRAHAASYAHIAYQTAYFKANYPAEFMAALLTGDHGDTDRIAIEVEECREMHLTVLPPDVNESFATFTVVKTDDGSEPRTIRFGLAAIKNVGEEVVRAVVAERKMRGSYRTLEDFLGRVHARDLNKKSLESLIQSGALDALGERHQMLENLPELLLFMKNAEQEVQRKQSNLFGSLPLAHAPSLRLRPTDPASMTEKLAWEKQLLGLYVSSHPLADFADALQGVTVPIRELPEGTKTVRIAGVVTSVKRILTKANEPMLFVKLEDTSSAIEVLVFPSVLKAQPELWVEERILLVTGKRSDKDGVPKLLCDSAEELTRERLAASASRVGTGNAEQLTIVLDANHADQGTITELRLILRRHPGSAKVHLKILDPAGTPKLIATNYFVARSPEFIATIRNLVGIHAVLT